MIEIPGRGWVQWDGQLGTYRGEIDGQIYGGFTGDIATIADFQIRANVLLGLAAVEELAEAKGAWLARTADRPAGDGISRYEFASRFTIAEEAGIREAAKSDPAIEVFLRRLDLYEGALHPSAAFVRDGLAYLVQAGKLSAERAAIIGA